MRTTPPILLLLLSSFALLTAGCRSAPTTQPTPPITAEQQLCPPVPELTKRECQQLTDDEIRLLSNASPRGFYEILEYLHDHEDLPPSTLHSFEKVLQQWPDHIRRLDLATFLDSRFEDQPFLTSFTRTLDVDFQEHPSDLIFDLLNSEEFLAATKATHRLITAQPELAELQYLLTTGQFENIHHLKLGTQKLCADNLDQLFQMDHFRDLETLILFDFRHCTEDQSDLPRFHQLENLSRLQIRTLHTHRLNTEPLSTSLSGLPLENLELRSSGVTDRSLQNILNLERFQNLHQLHLDGNPITNDGLLTLLLAIPNTHIDVVTLAGTSLTNGFTNILIEHFPEQLTIIEIAATGMNLQDFDLLYEHQDIYGSQIQGFFGPEELAD